MILFGAPPERPRWLRAAGIVLLVHCAAFAAFLVHPAAHTLDAAATPSMAIDMAPMAAAPPQPHQDNRPTQQQVEAPKPKPIDAPRTRKPPFDPPPELKIAGVNPDVTVPKKQEEAHEPDPARPPSPETTQAAAPDTKPDKKLVAPMVGGTSSGKPSPADLWSARVRAKIDQQKRYPSAALSAHLKDVITAVLTIDRKGRVLSAQIAQSRGFGPLDREALDVIHRVSPLPKPPATGLDGDTGGDTIELSVYITFFPPSAR